MELIRRLFLILLIGSFSLGANAQDGKYMVFFKDKTGTPYTISNPSQFLSAKSISRRTKNGITVSSRDLPVNPAYVSSVRNTGVLVLHQTKWMNGVLVQGTEDKIDQIRALNIVDRVEFVAQMPPQAQRNPSPFQTFKNTLENISMMVSGVTNSNLEQLTFHGIEKMHQEGFTGQGVTIAIFDDGFLGVNTSPHFAHVFSNNRVIGTKDFVNNHSNVYHTWGHGARVFSTIGAIPGPNITGVAYNANFVFCITEDSFSEQRIEEYNWLFAAEYADSIGVDVINTSLGYSTFDNASFNYTPAQMDGKTTVIAKAAEMAFETGMILVNSAGNYGGSSWNIIASPADAPNVLAVGAVTKAKAVASFSSRGPGTPGVVKPDAMAVGQQTVVVMVSGAINFQNGTSFASPIITGFVANIMQEFPNVKYVDIRDAIRKAGDRFSSPDVNFGYGIPEYQRVKEQLIVTSIRNPKEIKHQVYPNPARNSLFIKTEPYFPENSELSFRIYDAAGRTWVQTNTTTLNGAFEGEIDISFLPRGYYIFHLSGSSKNLGLQFVKE